MATYDDSESVKLKTEYAIKHGMNRIMFGQLADDLFINGLLHVISAAKNWKEEISTLSGSNKSFHPAFFL